MDGGHGRDGEAASRADRAHRLNVVGALGIALADAQANALAEFDRPLSDALALLAVHERRGCSVRDLAGTLGSTHSGAVRVVDRLEDRGELERTPGADRRALALRLTSVGHRIARRMLEARTASLERFMASVTVDHLTALSRLSDAVLRGGSRTPEEAWRLCRFCEHEVCRGRACPTGSTVK